MNPAGTTRSVVLPGHALICPENQPATPISGWQRGCGVVQVSAAMGSRFTQIQAILEPTGVISGTRPWVERFVYVLEGEVLAEAGDLSLIMRPGDYFYAPPEQPHRLIARSSCRMLLFEHNYYALTGVEPPSPQFGRSRNAQGRAFRNDPDVLQQTLLPGDASFDMGVSLYSLYPGATLPGVLSDGTERGLLLLEGEGVARLGDHWHAVKAGDSIWTKGHTPFWFAATGKVVTRYLQYEDTNREPVEA